MKLDLPTLSAVFSQITAVLGALLMFSWALNRKVQALAWWSIAFFLVLAAIGVVSLGHGMPSAPERLIANVALTLAYGMLYGGCRVFNGRKAKLPVVFAGAGLWCVAFWLIPDDINVRLALISAICTVYAAFSAWELWRHARQRLASQMIAVVLMISLVIFNVMRGSIGFSLAHALWLTGYAERWSSSMAMAVATFMPTLAFVFLSMAKEQIEYEHRQAALVDHLTGIPNRRAFLENAAALLSKQDNPVSCLLFDLDNFKSINDRFGHEVGDHVLVIFGSVLSDHLPQGVFGRLGGEEFAAMVTMEAPGAEALAERIRHSFFSVGKIVQGLRVEVTVSVGCATGACIPVQHLLREADIALYRAKAQGRNLVTSFKTAVAQQS
ncbi:GGDEF domain-containing protein [Microvirga puerhi]|uniref:diguanylate cyclase n=1 Tax=Microvirga puerhi TaxID=2876078 RepID=A0ABS7VMQ8_9HYPH|nr:GGDEF domain-containing protein [Microvirga puerhi]MBZ6076420.1 GGDEF domain-containing protein [Microvirga puerhi]